MCRQTTHGILLFYFRNMLIIKQFVWEQAHWIYFRILILLCLIVSYFQLNHNNDRPRRYTNLPPKNQFQPIREKFLDGTFDSILKNNPTAPPQTNLPSRYPLYDIWPLPITIWVHTNIPNTSLWVISFGCPILAYLPTLPTLFYRQNVELQPFSKCVLPAPWIPDRCYPRHSFSLGHIHRHISCG